MNQYVADNNLDRLFDWDADSDFVEGIFDAVRFDLETPYPPDVKDLVRLHKLIREQHSFTVLEFGTGYSTPVIADALAKNERDWLSLPDRPKIRNRHPFQLITVDCSQPWLDVTRDRLPEDLVDRVSLHQSDCHVGTWQGQLCHYYTDLPDIVPDFVYLDGPHPKDVQGHRNGLTFHCDERTVMAADLLLMESTLIPGCVLHIDGRKNNARFLRRNFSRDWQPLGNQHGDVTTLELIEERLGYLNILGKDYFPHG